MACDLQRTESALDFAWQNDTLPFGPGVPWSVTWSGMLTPPQPSHPGSSPFTFSVQTDSPSSFTTLRVDDHPLLVAWAGTSSVPGGSGNSSAFYPVPLPGYGQYGTPGLAGGSTLHIEYTWNPLLRGAQAGGPQYWRLLVSGPGLPTPSPVPSSWLSPSLPPWEESYLAAKEEAEGAGGGEGTATTWGTYYSFDVLTLSRLPDGLSLSSSLQVGNRTLSGVGQTGPSCNTSSPYWGEIRLGPHGTGVNRSLYSVIESLPFQGWEWRVEYAALDGGADVAILLTVLAAPQAPQAEAYVHLAWGVPLDWAPRWCNTTLPLDLNTSTPALPATCPGVGAPTPTWVHLATDTDIPFTIDAGTARLSVGPLPALPGTVLAYYTGSTAYSSAQLEGVVGAARAALLDGAYGGSGEEDNETMAGMAASIGWNTVYVPLEGLVAPVTRGNPWGLSPRGYVLFLWDTALSSYLALGAGDTWLALSNIVRLMKNMEPGGFLNGHWEGTCGELNSKPPLASGALLALLRALLAQGQGEVGAWLVPLLAEKLLAFNRWWDATRFVPFPLHSSNRTVRLLSPGALALPFPSYACSSQDYSGLQGAKFETGLDNSPMYDNASYVGSSATIDQVDVGLSSMYARDSQVLAQLLSLALAQGWLPPSPSPSASAPSNVSAWVQELYERGNATAAGIEAALWSSSDSLWYNGVWTGNGSSPSSIPGALVQVPTPTSFYPLLLGSSGVDRVAAALARWLTNETEFCVVPPGSSPACNGSSLPSVARSQPSWGDNSYWRGRAWGPMTFLLYSALAQYQGTPLPQPIPSVMSSLAGQGRASFLLNWVGQRRIMENYSSKTGVGCDEGAGTRAAPFYHWGALHALIALDARGKLHSSVQGILRA